jgi:hypothetical protein
MNWTDQELDLLPQWVRRGICSAVVNVNEEKGKGEHPSICCGL